MNDYVLFYHLQYFMHILSILHKCVLLEKKKHCFFIVILYEK